MGLPERFLRTEQNIQLSYELPHRVHDALPFPIRAPNGSAILIYAHDSGLRVLWRGGHPFKPAAPPKTNGAASNAVVTIDSDDEGAGAAPAPAEFEEGEEGDVDPLNPFPAVLQQIDLVFGTAATRLAVCDAVEGLVVVAAACTDGFVRVVSLPSTPPAPELKAAKGKKAGRWGETVATLSGFTMPPDGTSMTYVKGEDEVKKPGSLLVASYSREVTGLMLLHKIPVLPGKDGKAHRLSTDHAAPYQTQYLSTPASSIDINHAGNIVLGDRTGTIRLYSPTIADGSWLLTLHTPFVKSETAFSSHKPVLDAKWVLGGKAVIVLLSDGEWGVWDLEGAGPGAPKGILGSQTIKGGALTPFNLSGYIDAAPSKTSRPTIATSKFAPMTPGTRRTIEPALFSGRHDNAAGGRISIVPLPKRSTTSAPNERVAFWIEDAYTIIPSLRSFWDAHQRRGGNLFNGSSGSGRVVRLEGVNLRGAHANAFAQAPAGVAAGGSPEIIIAAETRLVVVADLPEVHERLQRHKIPTAPPQHRDSKRKRDNFAIAEIDQMLDRMEDDDVPRFSRRAMAT